MAGHSQFKNIQYRKGAQDAKRANAFAKLSKRISLATKDGGSDPSMNSKLRAIMDEARCINMPKEKIDTAIKKGMGAGSSTIFESVIYESRIGDAALMIEVLTDNRNRTAGEVRRVLRNLDGFNDFGGASFLFKNMGIVAYDLSNTSINKESFLDDILILDDVEDIIDEGDIVGVLTSILKLSSTRNKLVDKYGTPISSRSIWMPHEFIEIEDGKKKSFISVISSLENMDDVISVDSNLFLNI